MNNKAKPSDFQSPLKLKKRSNLLALEQRFMFDAAAGDAAHEVLASPLKDVAQAPSAMLLKAESQAIQNVARYLQLTSDEEIFKTFSADETAPSAAWTERLSQLRASFATGTFQPALVTMDNASDLGAVAAFSAHGPEGGPTLFFNQFWMNVLDNESIVQILTEELGHAMDAALNAGKDTPGDEGQKFAALVGGRDIPDLASDNDAGWISSGGKTFEVEFASLKFVNAYAMVYDLNNNGAIDSPTETPAAKEQNLHNFNYSNPLGDVRIDDSSAGQMFSGNDVSATAIVIAGNTYYGWISRPIKSNGDVKGFYFWTDPQFTTFTLAQADGNADGDNNSLDNRGFVLVVDQAYFDGLATQTVGTDIDNVASLRTYKQVGSSSDRVDAALNALVTTNTAPVANNDTAIAIEEGGLNNASPGTDPAGNVLTNDTDADAGDTKIVTKVGTASTTLAVAATSTSANGTQVTGLYGLLTLGANGTYVYAVTNSSDAVQSLRTSSNTLTDTFTYQMVDSKGVASTAKITITVQGANDTPIAANDYNSAKSTLSSVSAANQYTSSDAFGSLATGNVLNNDSDVDQYAETKSVVGTTATGTYSSYNAGGTSTSLTFASTQGNSLNAVSVGDYAYTPEISANKYYVLKASDGSNITISSKVLNANGTYSIGLSATPTKYYNGTSDVAYTATNGSLIDFASSLNNGGKPSGIKEATISASSATNYATVTVTVTDGYVNVGMAVTGTNVPANAVVTAVSTSGALTTVTIDKALPSAPSGTLTFTGAGGTTLNGQYGNLVLNANGEYTYTPTVDLVTGGTDYFKYTMTDDGGLQSTATLAINVLTSASGDPNAVADTGTATEAGTAAGSPATGTLTTNDTAGTGANISANPVSAAKLMSASSFTSIASGSYIDITGAYGTLRVYATGAYTYTVSDGNAQVNALNSGDTLTEVFQYQLTNSLSKVDTTTLTITLQGANDAPLAQADSFITPEDTALTINTSSLLGNDSDPDNATLSVTGVSGASNCTVVLNGNGTITFTPAANFYGNASFTYTVSDGSGGTTTATVTVAVVPVLDVPVAQANTYAANPSSLLTGLNVLTNTDTTAGLDTVDALFVNADLVIGKVNGSAFTADGTEANHLAADGWMQVALTNGTLYIKQDGTLNYYSANAGTTDTFTYTAIDPSGAESSTATVTLNVSNSVDTDLDGVADTSDIDDDNDGIIDTRELTAQNYASYASSTISSSLVADNGGYNKVYSSTVSNIAISNATGTLTITPSSAWRQDVPVLNTAGINNSTNYEPDITSSTPVINLVTGLNNSNTAYVEFELTLDKPVYSLVMHVANTDFVKTQFTGTHIETLLGGGTEAVLSGRVLRDSAPNTHSSITRDVYASVLITSADGGPLTSIRFRRIDDPNTTSDPDGYWITFSGATDRDTDADDIVDRLDIDSDNDGITDNIEAQATASYIAPSGQGVSMVDVDGDGLDDNYDSDKVIGTTTATTSKGLTPVNTDGDAKADYIDTDSDGDGMLDITERHDTQATSVTSTTDTDSDGLPDIFEAGIANDGFDVNDNNYDSNVFNLARALTVQADGLNATPMTADMLYRTSTALWVNSISVNEGSPYAVFKVTGAPGQLMTLALGNTSTTTDRDATLNTDTGDAGTGVPLQVNNGSGWVDYTPNSQVLIPLTSSQLLVRTKITNDNTFETAETFTLIATHTNATQVAGIATIRDDGTGDVFLATNNTETPNVATDVGYPASLDDDRPDTDQDGIVDAVDVDDDNDGILDVTESTSNYQWASYPSGVSNASNTVSGVMAGINFTYTLTKLSDNSALNLNSTSSVYNHSLFPESYAVPNINPTIRNDVASINTLSFASPILNPVLAFSSIGNPSNSVQIQFDRPVEVLWSTAVTVNSDTLLTGREGFMIVRIKGSISNFNFRYLNNETYVNFAFGADIRQDLDTDADGLVDRLDIDSDNDGITDNVEAQATANYITPSGQGGGMVDVDDDGLDDNYDSDRVIGTTTSSTSQGLTPVNTDGDSKADYTDTDSDGDGMLDITERHDTQATSVTSTTDTDSDGLLDIFEAGSTNDGFDVNDNNYDSNVFNLVRALTVQADGSNATPMTADMLYRTSTAISVNSITVNEGSPYAIFKVTGSPGQLMTLAIGNTSATTDRDATLNTDTGNAGTSVPLQVNDGTGWIDYTPNSQVLIPLASTHLLVRTKITNDSTYESAETFTLVATHTNTSQVTGIATIKDDGTGDVFLETNTTDTPNIATDSGYPASLDDDRTLSINTINVNEGSPYGVFTVTANIGETLTLALANGTAINNTGNSAAVDGSVDFGPVLEYSTNGGTTWTTYTTGFAVPGSGTGTASVLVRTAIVNDGLFENSQNFTLTAAYTSGVSRSSNGTANIKDDGTGDWYAGTSGTGSATAPAGYTLNDDRALSVNTINVNEGSPYGVFTVTANIGQTLTLALGNGTATNNTGNSAATDGSVDFGPVLEYSTDGGSTWTIYTAGFAVPGTGTGTASILVRTAIVNDTVHEKSQDFTLTASYASGASRSSDGSANIKDDGTGDWFDGTNATGSATAPTGSTLNDDRTLSINTINVNEGSPYGVFTVTANIGETLTLALANGTAINNTGNSTAVDGSVDFGPVLEYSTNGGTTWTTYTTGFAVPGSGTGTASVLVRTAIVNDTVYEKSHDFTLTAGYTSGASRSTSGTANILDDGTGQWFDGTGGNGSNTAPAGKQMDDDQPKPIIIPTPPAPPPAAPPKAPEPPAAPPAIVIKPFNSAVQPLEVKLAPPTELPRAPIGEILTNNAGFRIVSIENAPPGLTLNKGVTDQFVEQGASNGKFTIPYDAFMHSKQDAVIKLQAKQANDAPLPSWATFDPQAGTFDVKPPPNFKGKVELKVIARDDDGREAVSIFRLFVGEEAPAEEKPQSRNSLSEKIRLAAKRANPAAIRVMQESVERKAPAAESAQAG